ncbi:HAMP domain-containing histidine kinase [Catellatospora sp. NEAU-YM18]|nr:HAMP domain-containing histidine kinase [Catellatospora tritici]
MVVAVVGLAALALLVTNLAATTTLKHYLVQQLDEDVRGLSGYGFPGAGAFGGNRPQPTATPTPSVNPPAGQAPRNGPGRFVERGLPPGMSDTIVLVYDSAGALKDYYSNSNLGPENAPMLGSVDEMKSWPEGRPFTASSHDGTEYRVVIRSGAAGYRVVASSLSRVEATSNLMLFGGLAVSGLVLLGLGFAAHRVVRIGLGPLTEMEQAAAHIAGGDLTVRVPSPDPHTEPGRLGIALNTMLGRIESAVTARTQSEQRLRQFLADASHELRTPLTSIRGFAELYRRGGAPPGPELDETMSRIEQEASRMGLLVEDLLLLAALDEERPLQRGQVDLLVVAADTVRDAHVRSPGRNVELDGFEPVTVLGDEHRLRQVATNLVANALQHTPASARITLAVSRRDDDDDRERFELPVHRDPLPVVAAVGADLPEGLPLAVVEVTDTGPGVPLQHAERIFERLYRADPHRARSHGGAGLGLAIATAIVQSHGGRIELATAPGAGSTFRVLLPLYV